MNKWIAIASMAWMCVLAAPELCEGGHAVAALPPELHVVSNRLETADGKVVWLQGVNIASLEWRVDGDHVMKSIPVAIEEWKANTIRLPVKETFWFGREKGQNDGGAGYRVLVDDCVEAIASRGAYVVLDLHRFRAPLDEHVEFWKDAAVRYKNHPAVLFDLLNEPHKISWEVWRDGGLLDEGKSKDVNPTEVIEKTEAVRSPGMQALVDAVRSTGARNIIVAGGLDWGYDLSGLTNGFALKEREGGNGIMYASHIYPWKRGWQKKVLPAAALYPIFVGEVGCSLKRMPNIPPSAHEDPYTWAPDVLGLIQSNKLHWAGWCFHTGAAPLMLSDWNYTPTPYWGAFAKDALAGKAFVLKKLR